jgi:hypothetical protein
MYKSSLRHIHDPVLSSLKMKGILSFYMPGSHMLRTFKEGSLFCVETRLLAEWSGFRIPFGATITLFLACSNRPEPTLPSILWVPGLTQTGREVDCSRISGAEVQNEFSYKSTVVLSWCG